MNNRCFILVCIVVGIVTIPVFGQSSDTPSAAPKVTEPKKADTRNKSTTKEPEQRQFLDRNANGIDDAKESLGTNNQQSKKRNRVRFIDADGDGICDGRASGAGLKLRIRGNHAPQQPQKGRK